MEDFSIHAKVEGTTVHATVRGDLDLASADRFRRAVSPLLLPGRDVVLDCSGIGFLDSTALRTIINLDRRTAELGGRLVLAAVPAPVARVLDLAGATGMLTVQDRIADPGPS